MKTNFAALTLITLSIAITGCRREPYPIDPALGRTAFVDEHSRPADRDEPEPEAEDAEAADAPEENVDQRATPPANPTPPPPVPLDHGVRFQPTLAKKVEGKPGFVESPFAQGKLIDVRGLPPGTEIECPYSKRPIAVP
ncbi:MAG: hypothetical protein RL088_1875 [Verrucomicrobiota bacterium]|jgi:hypothetical protein